MAAHSRATQQHKLASALAHAAIAIPSAESLKSLSMQVERFPVVLLGEASHGTSDFYRLRQHLSRSLLRESSPVRFRFIAVEGDWPACYAVHRYVTRGIGGSAEAVLKAEFRRWPPWMWANREMVDFLDWLRAHNSQLAPYDRVGFFGLDVYSLYESIEAVVEELGHVDPAMAEEAKRHYACFDRVGGGDEKRYTRSLLFRPEGCREQVISVLRKLLRKKMPVHDGDSDEDPNDPDSHIFNAKQNAIVVKDAENYYRTMVLGDGESWNVRDYHMADTLQRLMHAYASCATKRGGTDTKKPVGAIVWAHNTHVGDHRFSDMMKRGEITIGGVMRERVGEENVCLVGFGTYRGSVIAARDQWGDPPKVLEVPPAVSGSYDDVMNRVSLQQKMPVWYVMFRKDDVEVKERMGGESKEKEGEGKEEKEEKEEVDFRKEFGDFTAGQRAMGVVYDPRIEFLGNYVPCQIVKRYDSFVFVHTSRALKPLAAKVDPTEVPETYPTGV